MERVELNKSYIDGHGELWQVIAVDGHRQQGPVTAAHWEGKRYITRTFQSDGRYFKDRTDGWDLVREAPPLPKC